MRRATTTLTTALLAATLGGTTLMGCSSSDKATGSDKTSGSDKAANGSPSASSSPSASATSSAATATKASHGHLDYTGDTTGRADFTASVSCEVTGGKLIGVTAPGKSDTSAPKSPLFIATAAASQKLALMHTTDTRSYVERRSGTVEGHKSGAVWTVTVRNLALAKDFGGTSNIITVNGSLTCTDITE
jgi:hypothetical protein